MLLLYYYKYDMKHKDYICGQCGPLSFLPPPLSSPILISLLSLLLPLLGGSAWGPDTAALCTQTAILPSTKC